MRLVLLLIVLPWMAAAQSCPPAPDISDAKSVWMRKLQFAPDASVAQTINTEIWLLWSTAPDAKAQELLDNGMERRSAYDFERARAFLTELIEYCPNYAEGWNQRAFVHFLNGDYAMAVDDLDKALELSPDHYAAMSGLALSLMNLGRMEAAQSILSDAVALNPWLPERSMLIDDPKGTEL
ncbi:MAG: tetratricopeptide repeat protein [Deltaproteobacteria bacterium]